MIEDTTLQFSQIPNNSFTYTPQISRFMQALEYNMKVRAGINPSVSNEELADQRNIEQEEDLIATTENTLTKIDHSNPETMNSLLQSYRAYGHLLKSNPATAVIESFTDADIADRIVSDDVYRINATNTDQDYPVYMTRGAIFESTLLDSMENDNPSLYSYGRRFGAPVGLAIAGNVVKGTVGTVVAHGVTAAYDVSRLGSSIQNIQKKYYDWRNRLFDDKTLTYDKFLEESKKIFEDIKKNVPEEYRYEIYKALHEAPDPFSDMGNSFSGLGMDVGVIKPIGGALGVTKSGYDAAKSAVKGVSEGASKSKNVQKMRYNEELAEKIKNFATNKVDEEVVEDMTNTKAAVNKPEDASPELQDTLKGIAEEQNSDNNLLQNVNNDSYRYDLTVSQEDIATHNTSSTVAKMNEEPTTTLYEIIPESRRPKQSYFIDHGKGVNGDQPLTYEEAFELLRKMQGRVNRAYPWIYSNNASLLWDPDIEPEYIAIQSASRRSWSKNKNMPGVWDYEGHQSSGAGDEWFLGGGYASEQASPWVAAKGYYYKEFSPNIFDFRDYVQQSIINDADTLKYAISKYDPNGKYYRRAFKIYEKDRNKALQKWKEDLSSAYALESWMNRQGLSENEVDALLEVEKNLFGINHIQETRTIVLENTSKAALKVASVLSGDAEGNISDIVKNAIETLKYEDKELKKDIVKFIDLYKKFVKNELDLLHFKQNEEELFEYYRFIVEEQNKDAFYKPRFIKDPSTLGEAQYSELINLYSNILDRSLDNEGLNNLIQMLEHPEKYSPPSAHLQTLGIRNPMKNPEGVLYFDSNRGLIPFSSLFSGVRYDFKNPSKYNEYSKKLRDIQKRDSIRINKVKKDIIDGFFKKIDQMKGDESFVLWTGLPDDPEPWNAFSKNSDRTEALKSFKRYLKENHSFNHLSRFRDLLKEFVKPFSDIDAKNYNAWERAYLHEKGLRHNWHNGGGSESFNVSIQDFDDVTPVTLDVTGIGTPWQTVIAYDNAHFLVKAGDGVGYFVRELHGVKGAKPMIIKSGKGIDKNDFILDMGDYKPYNKKKTD